MNEEMNNESLRTGAAVIDDTLIWTIDEIIGGLYTINRVTFEVENVLDPLQVFKYGKFKIQSIFRWKDFIILVPSELNKRWVIYDKKNRVVEYKEVVACTGRTTGIYIIGEMGFLIPATTDVPVIIINIETMTIFQLIRNWNRTIEDSSNGFLESRTGIIADEDAFFYLFDTKYLIKIAPCAVETFRLQIPYGICSISYSDNGIWVLPTEGNYIYRVDKEGWIIEQVAFNLNNEMISASDFVRIVSTNRYIFLLPLSKRSIYVFDRLNKVFLTVNVKDESLKNKIPALCYTTPYWEYCIENRMLYFMPLENKLLEINLETFELKQKNTYLPALISGRSLLDWYGWGRWLVKGNVDKECDSYSLNLYCDVVEKSNVMCKRENRCQGERIWRKVKP